MIKVDELIRKRAKSIRVIALVLLFGHSGIACHRAEREGRSEVHGLAGRVFQSVPRAAQKSDEMVRLFANRLGKKVVQNRCVLDPKKIWQQRLIEELRRENGLPRSQLTGVLDGLLASSDGCDGLPCRPFMPINRNQIGAFLDELRWEVTHSEIFSNQQNKNLRAIVLGSLVDDKLPAADILADGIVRRRLDLTLFQSAKIVIDKVFKEEAGENLGAAEEIWESIEGRRYTERETGKIVIGSKYWVAVDENTDDVGGIIGLYRYQDDMDAEWVNWFAVDPTFRGFRLGEKLLDSAIGEAKKSGRPYLRLFTDDEPYEAAAQKVYESRGLKEVGRERHPGSQYHRIFRELKLH